MPDRNEVKEYLTDGGIVKVVWLRCRGIDGISSDSIYLQLQVELPGSKHAKVWVSKGQLEFAVRLNDTLLYVTREVPFVIEEPKKDQLFPPDTSVVIKGVHNAAEATVIPVYRSRQEAIAAA